MNKKRHNQAMWRGFSLIELVTVLVIVGVLAAIAAPRFVGAFSRSRLDAAAKRLVADLNYARSNAQITGTPRQVVFNVPGNTYELVGVQHLDQPAATYTVGTDELFGAAVNSADCGGDATLSFNGHGVPDSAATIELSLGGITRTIVVDPDSGKASAP